MRPSGEPGAGERDRAAAMAIPWRREDFLLGRWAAKRLLSAVLGCAPGAAMEVRAAPSGRPEAFLDGQPLRLSLSISHREGLALAAIDDAGGPLGADLEAVEPRSDAFVRDYFTRSEIAAVAAGERNLLANLIWSAKESALKALGVGLTLDTREVEVELGEHGQHKLLDRIDRRLLKVGAQRAGFSSKLGRLLADRMLPRAAPPHFARSAGRLYWLT